MSELARLVTMHGTITLNMGEYLLEGIPAERFARFMVVDGRAVESNHPAFVYGHLSLYPARALETAGLDPAAAGVPEGYDELFRPGVACRDDPDGSIYPPMSSIVEVFRATHGALVSAMPGASDAVLTAETPDEKRRERWPTNGCVCDFYVGGHAMLHLGQVSAWRRVMGLGSAM